MAYLFHNTCTKNYWNWTTTVKIIVGHWVVYCFGGHSVEAHEQLGQRTMNQTWSVELRPRATRPTTDSRPSPASTNRLFSATTLSLFCSFPLLLLRSGREEVQSIDVMFSHSDGLYGTALCIPKR